MDHPDEPLFSLLLYLENGAEATLATLKSVAENTPATIEYDTLIFDDATTDATAQLLSQLSGTVQVMRSETAVGQAAALSQLAAAASAPLLLILRQGAVLMPGWAGPLFEALEDPAVAGAQPLVLGHEGAVASAGLDFRDDARPVVRWLGHAFPDELSAVEPVDGLDGVCGLVRTAAFAETSGLDPSFPAGAMRFAELSWRLTAGGSKLVVANRSRVSFEHPLDVEGGATRFQRLAADQARSSGGRKVTTVALYLPAFHRIPENDRWWGEGFTEWTNVVKAQPLFAGHEQPQLPADLGIYDLRVPQTRLAQAELAEHFGIGAFCYYHYWFGGKRLLEQPFAGVLSSGEPELPFCLCWANEDWRANWDGWSGEMLMAQDYSAEDDLQHISWLVDVFRDPRYLRVDGKPIFLIYRAHQLPDIQSTLACWREEARKQGIGELFLCRVESFAEEHDDPRELGFDASVEFQPDWIELGRVPSTTGPAQALHDYQTFARHMLGKPQPNWRRIPCVTPGWDNTARRGANATVLVNSRPELYRTWVETVARREEREHPDSPLLFVNAWNEWGEGAHLEPDARWGNGYLDAHQQATRAAGKPLSRDKVLCVAGMHLSGVESAGSWLAGCGFGIRQADSGWSAIDREAISRRHPNSDGWRVLDDSACWFSPTEVASARQVIAQSRRASPHWGWADPCSTLLLEAWSDLIPDLSTLLVWRPCGDVVRAMLRSFSYTVAPDSQLSQAETVAAVWLAYNRRVLAYQRLYPERSVLISIADLTTQPERARASLREHFGVSLPDGPPVRPFEPPQPDQQPPLELGALAAEAEQVERKLQQLSL